LLEPNRQPVPFRPVLDPVRPIDQLSRDSLEPELEEQAMMRFEQAVGNMDWEIRVDPDQMAIESAWWIFVNGRPFERLAAQTARSHP
jgi:hypothetical protein